MSTTRIRPGTVVAGIDGSDHGVRALDWATDQAAAEGRTLTLVHSVASSGSPWSDAYEIAAGRLKDDLTNEGESLLEQSRDHVAQRSSRVEVQTLLLTSDPRVSLLEAAAEAAYLVVGARGRGPVARLVLGSVSAAVARQGPCPVVVVRPEREDAVREGVLVGIDADGRSQHCVELGFDLAASRGLALTVMHCVLEVHGREPGEPEVAYDTPGFEVQRLVLDEAVAGLREQFPDVDVRLVIGRGWVEECLQLTAERMDVLVVGAHRSGVLTTLLDRHTDRTVVNTAASVVVVVPEPERPRRG